MLKNQKFEVIGTNLETWENESIIVRGHLSFLDIQKIMYDNFGIELDVQMTLENYLDHAWVNKHILEIENDYKVMSYPIGKLLNDYAIYSLYK
jgi:hypothetical protein